MIFPPLRRPIRSSNPQFRSHLTTPIQKQPNRITLSHPHRPSRYIRSIVEYKRYQYLRILNRLLHSQKLLPQRIPRLRFFFHRCLGHRPRRRRRIRIRRDSSSTFITGTGCLRCRSRDTRFPRRARVFPGIVIIIIISKREFTLRKRLFRFLLLLRRSFAS